MRKCEKCGASMKLDLRLKANGGGYGIVVRVDEKQKATTIDDVRVAAVSYTHLMHLNPAHQSVKSCVRYLCRASARLQIFSLSFARC